MAVRTRDELMESVRTRFGEDTSDEAIQFIEDLTDTLTELEKNEGEDWQKKYEENDKMWREKYTNRFYSSDSTQAETIIDVTESVVEESEEKKTFEDLFG